MLTFLALCPETAFVVFSFYFVNKYNFYLIVLNFGRVLVLLSNLEQRLATFSGKRDRGLVLDDAMSPLNVWVPDLLEEA